MTRNVRQLRTIHVTTSLERDQGGPPISVFNYSACSLFAGIRAAVATTFDPNRNESSVRAKIEESGIQVFVFPRSTLFGKYAKRWGISFPLVWWIVREAKNYDIVLIHGGWSLSSVAGLMAARLSRRPCILVPHESLTKYDVRRRGSVLRIIMKSVLRTTYWRYCDLLIFASRLERDDSIIESRKARTALLPHPIFDDRIGPINATGEIKQHFQRLGFIGRLHPKKNVAVVIAAISQLSADVSLTIAGDGPPEIKAPLLALAHAQGLTGRIEWLGFVEGTSKEEFFRRIDLLAMPSEYESFGLAAAEAMVRGVPAIVTKRSGIAEVITEFGGGLVCEPRAEDLARELQKLEQEPSLVSELSRQAIQTTTKHLSFSAFGAALKACYLSVLPKEGSESIRGAVD
jgi:glycosyltransferase involved in cell wall biosynthesis